MMLVGLNQQTLHKHIFMKPIHAAFTWYGRLTMELMILLLLMGRSKLVWEKFKYVCLEEIGPYKLDFLSTFQIKLI